MNSVAGIKICFEGNEIKISREVYELLFENSCIYDYRGFRESLIVGKINFRDFVVLARKANLPYSLFFAPLKFVRKSIDQKYKILLSGTSKGCFSMNSRGNVKLQDIELIIRDLLRKQELLKKHNKKILDNKIYHLLRKSRMSVGEQANVLRDEIGINLNVIKSLNKEKSFEYLVRLLEEKMVFISQSSHSFMPQIIRPHVKFSGLCLKDKKIPFIFLNNKEETKSFEPEGRKILTLVLLAVCLAKGKFSPISYNDQTKAIITNEEFLITEEILMPSEEMTGLEIENLEDIKDLSQRYSLTPSALLMRLRRLEVINRETADEYFEELQNEFVSNLTLVGRPRRPTEIKGYKKYNSTAFSKSLINLVNTGKVSHKEALKILFPKNKPVHFFYDYQANL